MRSFLLAPDSFKGTLHAQEVCDIWERAIRARLPDAALRSFPMADGGEGMVHAYLRICGGKQVIARVSGPFGEPLEAAYGLLPDGRAVLEMAACAGLPLARGRRDPERATTYGVGEMILHAAGQGAAEILLGLGGSATNDCGMGMAAALGYRFWDGTGKPLEPLALNMGRVARIEPPATLPKIRVIAACDVDNPLFGPTGATYTFGPQKGVSPEMAPLLDAGLQNMAARMEADLNAALVADVPGSGAAGGLGAGCIAFLRGELRPGIELLLDAAGFDEALQSADIVFTGEGRIDGQSARGKAPVGIARRCRKAGVPCVALCGSIGEGAEAVYEEGVTAMFSALRETGSLEDARRTCREDMRLLTEAVLRLLLLPRA